jgi:SH3-like domain-containing protein
MMKKIVKVSLLAFLMLYNDAVSAEEQARAIPRFASIRSDKVNLRRGPGTRYPCDWVYVRAGLPVEIIAEYGTWRKIRDHEGTEGWMHQAMLSGRRKLIVTSSSAKLYKKAEGGSGGMPEDRSNIIAIAEKNVTGNVLECKPQRCKVQLSGHKGWIDRSDIWGVRAGEEKIK